MLVSGGAMLAHCRGRKRKTRRVVANLILEIKADKNRSIFLML